MLLIELVLKFQRLQINLVIELNIDVDGVVVEIDGKKYYVDLTNGKGSLVLNGLINGTYTAVVKYLGDSTYDVKSNSTIFAVDAKKPQDFMYI